MLVFFLFVKINFSVEAVVVEHLCCVEDVFFCMDRFTSGTGIGPETATKSGDTNTYLQALLMDLEDCGGVPCQHCFRRSMTFFWLRMIA